jgi:transcriptional regulator with GAF, ATPase, and Fis domain
LNASGVTRADRGSEDDARLNRVVAEAASELSTASDREIVDTVRGILEQLIEAVDVDRAEFLQGSDAIASVHSSIRVASTATDRTAGLSGPDLQSVLSQLPAGDGVLVLGGSPSGTASAGHHGVAVRVAVGGSRGNSLILQTFRESRMWPDQTLSRLRLLAELMAAAVRRTREDRELAAVDPMVIPGVRKGRHNGDRLDPAGAADSLIVGDSLPLQAALNQAKRVASTDTTILLRGETGTGKELFAQTIHAHSPRSRYPLVSVNCVALPSALIESELFGHERGAFTGAVANRQGRFELADRGTLFLDEIGDLPLDLQAKLLRVLQERTFERVGASHTKKVDVRIIAATNRDLESAVANGQFREDLYYRLSVLQIRVPALRERRDDIPALVWSIIHRRQQALSRSIGSVSKTVMDALLAYSWPGNVRELENVVERALINSNADALTLTDDDFDAMTRSPEVKRSDLSSVERTHIQTVLRECDWRINGVGNAAERLGLHPNTLRFRMRKLGIVRTKPAKAEAGPPSALPSARGL